MATTLAGTRALFDGIPAPLLYTTGNQISAIVPYEVSGHTQTSLQVEYQGIPSAAFVLPVTAAIPGIFTRIHSGSGQGAIVNQDGTINSPDHPAPRGSRVAIYGTGDGQTLPAGVDGIIIGSVADLRYTLLPVTASIGGQNANVSYTGSAGGQVAGMFQANVDVPTDPDARFGAREPHHRYEHQPGGSNDSSAVVRLRRRYGRRGLGGISALVIAGINGGGHVVVCLTGGYG